MYQPSKFWVPIDLSIPGYMIAQAINIEICEGGCNSTVALVEVYPTLLGFQTIRRLIEEIRQACDAMGRLFFELHVPFQPIGVEDMHWMAEQKVTLIMSITQPVLADSAPLIQSLTELLCVQEVPFALDVLVCAQAAQSIEEIYHRLCGMGICHQQYTPLIPSLRDLSNERLYPLTPEAWGEYMKTLFVLWRNDWNRGSRVYIRELEALSGAIRGAAPEKHFFLSASGNICAPVFVSYDRENTSSACRKCRWVHLCHSCAEGHYYRELVEGNGSEGFCKAYSAYYEYTLPNMMYHLREQSHRHP